MKDMVYKIPNLKTAQIVAGRQILSGSIISESTVQASGQEKGQQYDFDLGTGGEFGKKFNHEWE